MRDFLLTADEIKDWVWDRNTNENTVVFDEAALYAYYKDNLKRKPADPLIVLYKPAYKSPNDPFGVVPEMRAADWSIPQQAVIIIVASRFQLDRVQYSLDHTLYVDTSFKKTR